MWTIYLKELLELARDRKTFCLHRVHSRCLRCR
jgi:hypothetical protein